MKRLVTALACALVLTGCSRSLSPADQLRDQTAAMVERANAKDLNGLRVALDQLRGTISDQLSSGQLSAARAATLTRLLSLIEKDAPTLTAPSPTPTPPPSPTASPTRSPTPSPTPSPTSSPTPSPTPSATPSHAPPVTAPPVTTAPTLGVGLGGNPPPTP